MKLRILVVDDDRVALALRKALLESDGHEVVTASDGKEGLSRIEAEEGNMDLVFSDINMPVMDGIEMLRRLRDRWPEIPVIIISGESQPEIRKKAMEIGANDFLLKPVLFKALRRSISRVMESWRKNKE